MSEIVSTIVAWAHLVMILCGIASALIVALQASRWGKSHAVRTAADLVGFVREIAAIAVRATEQMAALEARQPDGVPWSSSEKRQQATDAVQLAAAEHGVTVPQALVVQAIEAAVHEMNAGKAKKATK